MSSKDGEEDEEKEKVTRVQLSIPDKFLLSLGLQNDHREDATMRRREAKWYSLTGETPGTQYTSQPDFNIYLAIFKSRYE